MTGPAPSPQVQVHAGGYRREIDGLRALAVMPVLFFHAGFPGFAGGYVGVDVFLVISGYLITRIILAELGRGTFSFAGFYERRARRILPPLFAVLACAVPLGWVCLGPGDFQRFSRALLSVLGFGSNIHFWLQSGYFAPAAEASPLLHTWSLALEEQYYFIFPAVLLVVWRRWRSALLPVMVVGFALSLLLAHVGSVRFPGATFFLLPPRGWELLAGAILAARETERAPGPDHPLAGGLALLGIVLIAIAVTTFDATTRHPSLVTLLPVVGTMLVVRFGHVPGMAHRALSAAPVVAVGLLSYSLYLWHQPLLVFARLWLVTDLSIAGASAILALSVALAAASYRYVERPFRDRRATSRRVLVRSLAGAAVAIAAVAIAGERSNGFPARFDPPVLAAYEASGRDAARLLRQDAEKCHGRTPDRPCLLGSPEARPTWALLGDSHASVLATALDSALRHRREAALHFGQSGCPYVPGLEVTSHLGRLDCIARNQVIAARLASEGIRRVVLTARYGAYLHGRGLDNGLGGVDDDPIRLAPPDGAPDERTRRRAVLEGYARSVEGLLASGIEVVLVYPVPEQGWDVPLVVAQRRVVGRDEPLAVPRAVIDARYAAVDSTFDALGERPGLIRVRAASVFCDAGGDGACYAERDGRVLYSDHDHLSLDGAQLLFARLARALDAG